MYFRLVDLTKEGAYDPSIPHRHSYCEVFIFEVGGGQHHIDFNSYPIDDFSIHFVSPGQVHNVQRTDASKGRVMLFSRDFYAPNQQGMGRFPFLNNNSNRPILNLNREEFQALNVLLSNIRREQDLSDPLSDDLTQSYLNAFLIHSKRYFSDDRRQQYRSNDGLSFRFRQMIEEHFLTIHSVSEYAAMLNCSEKQLATSTKKELGVSPKELIYERILLEAKRLVLYTEYSFQEIAFFLSYSDASHFAKFFKGKTGHSPKSFRETEKMHLKRE